MAWKNGDAKLVTHEGVTMGTAAWARKLGIGKETVRSRIKNGMSRYEAIFSPIKSPAECGKGALTHGLSNTPIYRVWAGMMDRCYRPDSDSYRYYGARGIKVCERWHKFAAFHEDMGPRPAGMTLDRKNSNGNYDPGNVRWATPREQAYNKRNTYFVTYRGKKMTLDELSSLVGVDTRTLSSRIRCGWSIKRTIETPVRRYRVRAR